MLTTEQFKYFEMGWRRCMYELECNLRRKIDKETNYALHEQCTRRIMESFLLDTYHSFEVISECVRKEGEYL